MLVDYAVLKDALKVVEDIFDHSTCLEITDPLLHNLLGMLPGDISKGKKNLADACREHGWVALVFDGMRINVLDYPPTSEHLVVLWKDLIESHLQGQPVSIHSLVVKETCTSEVIVLG